MDDAMTRAGCKFKSSQDLIDEIHRLQPPARIFDCDAPCWITGLDELDSAFLFFFFFHGD